MKYRALSLILGVVAATVSGCGSTEPAKSVGGTHDPCALPDAAITAVGLVTADRMTGPVGAEFDGWQGCVWKSGAGWYDVAVYTGAPTLGEFQRDQRYQDYRAVASTTVGARAAVEFADRLDPDRRERCYLAVAQPHGMTLFLARIPYVRPGEQPPGDVCAEVRRVGAELSGKLSG
ncbi:DUF3558 domain-containing protein [Nocardia sp. CDC159]|uniref:DUF3558 domain-containing protein n=1 Tax=Nocardia pulmonis TaxID=2951408 RepID=A0A9X2IXL6_9NOCA|nr:MULTISPECIES: DUF3558 family protein [Nocardia]MCM6772976.1 DUF3558 domain-containing protein [Nocardia pulmonis]MCM6785721.1 DUF3558 domain-containing protein [Nocardia sp. CDC159]